MTVHAGSCHCGSVSFTYRSHERHFELEAAPMDYDAEDVGKRLERRRQRWSPTVIVEPEPTGGTDA